MAEKTEFYRWTFMGYDKSLYSQSHTLAEIIPELKIDEGYTFSSNTTNWEIARKVENCTVKRSAGSGAIPFIYVVPYEYDSKTYIKQIEYKVSPSGNIVTYFKWLQTDARARDSSTNPYDMDDYSLTQLNFSFNNPPYLDYFYNDSAVWVSGLITFPITYNTNIPIFKVANNFNWDTESSDLKNAVYNFMLHIITPEELIDGERILEIINADEETVPETTEYYCYCTAYEYTVDQYGNSIKTSSPMRYRGFRIKTKGRASLYAVEGVDDGNLKYMINYDDAEICYYSYDGDTWQNVIGSPTSLPFDFVWRKWLNEIGTFYASGIVNKMFYTNCLIFDNKADSDDYNDTGDGEEKASNFGEISDLLPPRNPTADDDIATTFGQVYTRAFFSQQYICPASAIQEIANAFFDTTQGGIAGIFEDIKKGLEMYGEGSGVVSAVQSCMFYPFDLNSVFTNTLSQNYIYFGGYKFDLQNSTVNKILYPNGFIDFGSIKIERTFNSYRDYSPYQRLYCYLPYLKWIELDLNKYLGKTVGVRYYIDTRTGLCMAVLTANGVFTDYVTGQIGVSMPLTLTDFSAYASAQIRTLCGGGANIGSGGAIGDMAKSGASNFMGGLAESGAIGLGSMAVAGVGVAGAVQGAKTLYGLTQNNINNFNKTIGGGSISMLNQYLPQEVCFMFEIQDSDMTPNEVPLQGLPSNASGTVGSFSGYLECEKVNLICSGATAKEQAEIIRYLYNGIYI